MELSLILEALKWVVPILIALISLVYAIKQRNVVKKEISKKRYLEDALSNLNAAMETLRTIRILDIKKSNDYEEWGDTATEFRMLTYEILRASFDLKMRKFVMNISYTANSYDKQTKESKVDLNDLESFLNALRSNRVWIYSHANIANVEMEFMNSPDFHHVTWDVESLVDALEALLKFEEAYESLRPDCVKNVKQAFEDVAKEIFVTVSQPKTIELVLAKFNTTDEISEHLCKEILNYPSLADKLSKVSELLSELSEARKELFMKVA